MGEVIGYNDLAFSCHSYNQRLGIEDRDELALSTLLTSCSWQNYTLFLMYIVNIRYTCQWSFFTTGTGHI
jgi:hypothetical protein